MGKMSAGVLISRSSGPLTDNPTTVVRVPRYTRRSTELPLTFRTMSWRPAPLNCATRVVVAIVRPTTSAIKAKITGKLTDTAPSPLAPTKWPTQMLSTTL